MGLAAIPREKMRMGNKKEAENKTKEPRPMIGWRTSASNRVGSGTLWR